MKATNKQEFFELLGYELGRLGIEDTADIFADFEEHFEDGAMQGIPDEQTAERLGDIKEIARSYLNLESSRINSIIARDNERKRISLTKPGRDVPADLSLLHKNTVDSDNIREYTPEHFSEEIYPNASNSNRTAPNFNTGYNTNSSTYSNTSTNTGFSANPGAGFSGNTGASQSAAGEKTVASAFSEAGRAALDAAKITGHAIKDAFGQSGVKDAVVGAGKTAADAVKTAGKSAADAVKKAKSKHESTNTGQSVPQSSQSYRANHSSSRQGTIPPQYGKPNKKKGYRIIDTRDMKTDVNAIGMAVCILLDVFLWSWLVPLVFSLAFAVPFGYAFWYVGEAFTALVGGANFWGFYFISRLFLAGAFLALAVILVCAGILLIKLSVRLVKYIINLHIKAVYNL